MKKLQRNRKQSQYYKYYYRRNYADWLRESMAESFSKARGVVHAFQLAEDLTGMKYIEKCLQFLYSMPISRKNFDFLYVEALKYAMQKLEGMSSKRAARELSIPEMDSKADVEKIMLICLRGSNITCSPKEFLKSMVFDF
ncbi:MAG: hypothetical protein J6A04_00460 [Clostridia bacterium]|nr:hypothetical protein [Clostridia bacterium]